MLTLLILCLKQNLCKTKTTTSNLKLKTTAKEKIVEEEAKIFAPLEQVGVTLFSDASQIAQASVV